eukprot:CAMPEP_0114375188 /NCGR_PEP_ID=MMETSP0101-20121206/36121_1 /TAXON_ID=38822 ORGANISM="Pteridomonas danica, Strain PT" /NCGR_SAMPLE_ID=MMETSP0101 /ASSEMBLY_ACC=CAM_ASM_000211 /LENGTH=294 /DNA_ID=CAMNT_0001529189 /DNA_START=366 /DNA_END=1251 /DNA_ORIENTATION=+
MGGPLLIPANWTSDDILTTNTGEQLPPDQREEFQIGDWCNWNYGTDICGDIYRNAIEDSVQYAQFQVRLIAIASFVNVLILAICLNLTTSIVTPAILMKYMSRKVNAMLFLPGSALLYIGLDLSGATLTQSEGDEVDFRQIEPDIVTLGKLHCEYPPALMMFGFYRELFRNRTWLHFYSGVLTIAFVLLAVEGIWCIVLAADIEDTLSNEGWEGGSFACRAGLYGCSNCDFIQDDDEAAVKCPEWSKKDIINYVQVYLTASGLTAMTSMIYVGAGIITAMKLSKKLREYRVEYV